MSGMRLARRAAIAKTAPPPWTPLDGGNLRAWYRADAGLLDASDAPITVDGTAIKTWQDQSGNGHHLTQATAGKRPTYKTGAMNGLPGVRCDGVSRFLDHLAGADIVAGTTLTLAVVHVRRVAHANSILVSCHNSPRAVDWDDASQFEYHTGGAGTATAVYRNATLTNSGFFATDGTPALDVVWFDGTQANQRSNGATAAPVPAAASTGSFAIDHLVIGAGWSASAAAAFSQADFCELLLYQGDIGSTQRTNLEAYTDRWGL